MKLGDMVRDISSPVTSRQRKDDLIRQLNELGDRDQKYQTWLRFVGSDPVFEKITSRRGVFSRSPIEGIGMSRSADLSVNDSTITAVSWGGVTESTNILQVKTSTTFVFPSYAIARMLGFIGQMNWAPSATGRREFSIQVYDKDMVQLYGTTLVSLPAHGVSEDSEPIAGTLYIPDTIQARYLKTSVYQTSGGALDLRFISLGIFALI